MNDKTSDKWDVVKWYGKIIKYILVCQNDIFYRTSATDALRILIKAKK